MILNLWPLSEERQPVFGGEMSFNFDAPAETELQGREGVSA